MAEAQVRYEDISDIRRNINVLSQQLERVDVRVSTVDSHVNIVNGELEKLAQQFREYVEVSKRNVERQLAETKLIKIRQEIETKFGHYKEIRRTTTGILQADDLSIVRKSTIADVTEENMLKAPNYWLAPCLVALAAWINDQPTIADRAVAEGIRRNDEKTSLFFSLICRRANRPKGCLEWAKRYFDNQDAENLDRKCIIMLDAYASGLLGVDSENMVADKIQEWIGRLEEKDNYVENQVSQWKNAIYSKRKPIPADKYPYLRKYSSTWPQLQDIMEGAYLHNDMFNYLEGIFNQEVDVKSINEQLDEILDSLVTDFDDEEIPLRKGERFNQMIIDYDGDKERAQRDMTVEQTAFETKKDFTQLLTDAAMKPESTKSSPATQRLAFSLSKEWLAEAYRGVVAANRMKNPIDIDVHFDVYDKTFRSKTRDGGNEYEVISQYNNFIDTNKNEALSKLTMTMSQIFALYGGIIIAVLGLVALVTGHFFIGVIAAVAGIWMILHHFSIKKNMEQQRININNQFEENRTNGTQILRATLAEVVDFRMEFEEKDLESKKTEDFIDGLSPDQYIKKTANTSRRIKMDV